MHEILRKENLKGLIKNLGKRTYPSGITSEMNNFIVSLQNSSIVSVKPPVLV